MVFVIASSNCNHLSMSVTLIDYLVAPCSSFSGLTCNSAKMWLLAEPALDALGVVDMPYLHKYYLKQQA